MTPGVSQPLPGQGFAPWLRERTASLSERAYERIDASPPGFRAASVLVPMWEHEGRVQVALTLRTAHLSAHSGQISFPGGRRDPEDTSLMATALRETEEELGIPSAAVKDIVRFDDAWSIQRYIVATYVGWLEERPTLVPSPHEIERVIIADVEELMFGGLHRVVRMKRGGARFDVHYFDVGDDTVWGLTGGILYGLFEAVRGRELAPSSRASVTLAQFLDGAAPS